MMRLFYHDHDLTETGAAVVTMIMVIAILASAVAYCVRM